MEVRRGYRCKHTASSLHTDELQILHPELHSKKPYKTCPPSCPTVKGGITYPYTPAPHWPGVPPRPCIQAHVQVAHIGMPNKKPSS